MAAGNTDTTGGCCLARNVSGALNSLIRRKLYVFARFLDLLDSRFGVMNSSKFSIRQAACESLEPRLLMTAVQGLPAALFGSAESQHAVSLASDGLSIATELPFREEFLVSANADTAVDQQSIELLNESDFTARFMMQFNGQISKDIAQLVEQIRTTEIPGAEGLPDYQRAYHYMMQFARHDFPLSVRTWMHEPSLYMNSLGAGLCDDVSSVLVGIWREMGYDARVILLSGHVVSEVNTGERWEMYDADLRVTYTNDDGNVAGVEELSLNPDLIYSPRNPTSENEFVYSKRVASFYWTTEDNFVCLTCNDYAKARDLVFEIPAGGKMSWGETYAEQKLLTKHLDSPKSLGQLKITIPAGSSGTLDIPLAIYDILGSAQDTVAIGNTTVGLNGSEPFQFLAQDPASGNRVQTISYESNIEPIEVIYFFNQQFTQIQAQNLIELQHVTRIPAALFVGPKEVPITAAAVAAPEPAESNDAVVQDDSELEIALAPIVNAPVANDEQESMGVEPITETRAVPQPELVDALVSDLNEDGIINFKDFVVLARNFGSDSPATGLDGDLDGDGMVSFADFVILAANFGSSI